MAKVRIGGLAGAIGEKQTSATHNCSFAGPNNLVVV